MHLFLIFMMGAVVAIKMSFCSANMQIVPVLKVNDDSEEEEDSDIYSYQITDKLSSKQLKAVYRKAKHVSRSKGPIINFKDGENQQVEYRRSLIRKIEFETKSHALRKVMKILDLNSTNLVQYLYSLEHLVHQYDIAVDFTNLGGMDLILPLIKHEDEKIVSVAFSILTAAMQGNPVVQKHASKLHVLDKILASLTDKSPRFLPGILYALSSYLRNMPDSQISFFKSDGIRLLTNIVKSHTDVLKYKLQAINILNDLAVEIFRIVEKDQRALQLQRTFSDGILNAGVCEEIPGFLKCNEFVIHEKVIDAMNSLHHICNEVFIKRHVIGSIEKLLRFYDPYSQKLWYLGPDRELKWILHEELKTLYTKLDPKKQYLKKTDF